MVFGKKKLKPSQLAPPPSPTEPAKTPDKPANAKTARSSKRPGKKPSGEPQSSEKPRGLIEPLEDRQHI